MNAPLTQSLCQFTPLLLLFLLPGRFLSLPILVAGRRLYLPHLLQASSTATLTPRLVRSPALYTPSRACYPLAHNFCSLFTKQNQKPQEGWATAESP